MYKKFIIPNRNLTGKELYFLVFLFLVFFISCKNENSNIENKKGGNTNFENAESILYGVTGKLNKENGDYYYFLSDDKPSIMDFQLYSLSTNELKLTLFDFNKKKIKTIDEAKAFLVTNIKNTNTNIINNIHSNFIDTMYGLYFPIVTKTYTNTLGKVKTNGNDYNKYYLLVENSGSEISKETNKENRLETEYKLIVKKRDFTGLEEREPNDTFNSANIFVINSEKMSHRIDGKYSQIFNDSFKTGELKNRENDIYKVTNSSYNSFILYFDVSAVPAVDTSIRVYDEKLNWLMLKDINIEGDGEKAGKLLLEPLGSYYFLINANNKSDLDYQVNVVSSDVNNIAKDSGEYIEFEVNNTPGKAMRVDFLKTYRGAIDYSNDIDYFSFTIPAKLKVDFSYFMLDSSAINISVSNSTLGKIATFNQRDDNFSAVLESGNYYLIFERDKTKEAWKKGISKEREYKFSISLE